MSYICRTTQVGFEPTPNGRKSAALTRLSYSVRSRPPVPALAYSLGSAACTGGEITSTR